MKINEVLRVDCNERFGIIIPARHFIYYHKSNVRRERLHVTKTSTIVTLSDPV